MRSHTKTVKLSKRKCSKRYKITNYLEIRNNKPSYAFSIFSTFLQFSLTAGESEVNEAKLGLRFVTG